MHELADNEERAPGSVRDSAAKKEEPESEKREVLLPHHGRDGAGRRELQAGGRPMAGGKDRSHAHPK